MVRPAGSADEMGGPDSAGSGCKTVSLKKTWQRACTSSQEPFRDKFGCYLSRGGAASWG